VVFLIRVYFSAISVHVSLALTFTSKNTRQKARRINVESTANLKQAFLAWLVAKVNELNFIRLINDDSNTET